MDKKIWVFEEYPPKFQFTKLSLDFVTKYAYFCMKLSLIIFWRKFSVLLSAYLIKEDVRNALLLLARKPWGTGMISWAAVSTRRSHYFGLHWSWSKNHRCLLSRCFAGSTSSTCYLKQRCWICGRNEVRINEDQMWTTKGRSRNGHHNRLA